MKNKRLILSLGLLGLLLVVAISLVTFTTIQAQTANKGLIVYPSNFDLTQDKDKKTEETVTVENLTDKPLDIQAELRNFTAQGEEGSVNLTEEDSTYALAKWITVTPSTVTIPAKEKQDFTFTINPPDNAEPGGHFGSIVFKTVPSGKVAGTGAQLSEEVASLILYKIPGAVAEQANVESFTTDKPFYEFGPVAFDTRVKNTGGIHIAPAGSIVVTGMFGQKYIVKFDPRNVLPNAVRKIPATLPNKFLIGKYKADLIGAYGTKNQQLNASTTFYAFPVRYGLVVLVILFFLFLARKRLGKAFKAILTGK